ncbi:ABC transporter ATP-binding protein [Peribacillus alkalitolerans]|uniref:ABC transporter ATP-binding protein n=1 Tax=Peribacillus alkalitolerans TaxID=1550385 RepID=UPI0013D243E9|nr:ABC transporter ATP-binding protein [Peribacillus alkalitolerans]
MMITFSNVTKNYGKEYAIKEASFTLTPGKIYGLLGPNGSGKSTTLKMIAGIVYPTEGKILIDEEIVTRQSAEKVAYLTELDYFYPSFTVKNMINFYESQFKNFNIERAYELIEFMNLDSDKKIKTLSKGNRGRLKLVLTLARETPIILLDEPFSGLDPMVRDSIVRGLLSYLDFEKQTVIIATHEILEVESLLDDIIAIKDGEILAIRNTEEMREQENISILEWMKMTFGE